MDTVYYHLNELDKHLRNIETLNHAEKFLVDFLSKQNPSLKDVKLSHIILGLFGFLLILVLFDVGGPTITNFIGFLYPAYASIRAIQVRDSKNEMQWFTYWVVFGFLVVFEGIFDGLISSIPFYFALKLIFVVWLFYPGTLGATVVYQNAIAKVPFFVANKEGTISEKINEISREAERIVEKELKID